MIFLGQPKVGQPKIGQPKIVTTQSRMTHPIV